MRKLNRRESIVGVAVSVVAPRVWAQEPSSYPSRPINLVVAWPPGGSVDVVARLISEHLRQQLGQPIVVTNRGGATGTIGANAVARATPDGYTLLMTIGAYSISAAFMPSLPFDPVHDLAALSMVVRAPNMLVARQDFPAKNLNEFIAMAKASPGKYSYSTAGVGTTTHLMTAMLEQAAGITLQHVPYQGGAASLQAILSGQTDLNAAVTSTAAPQLVAGKLRALAVVSENRLAQFPEIPTFTESGYPSVRGNSWIGLFAPSSTDRRIIDRINAVVQVFISDPANQEKLREQAGEPVYIGPREFGQIVRDEIRDFSALAKSVKIS